MNIRTLASVLISFAFLGAAVPAHSAPATPLPLAANAARLSKGDRIPAKAFKNRRTEFFVKFRGTVIVKLPDDLDGSRHQKFIVKLESGQTILIAHNIDLARRVAPLRKYDTVEVYGEYIWNDKGGLVHKTHRDADGSDPHGWIRKKGVKFQ